VEVGETPVTVARLGGTPARLVVDEPVVVDLALNAVWTEAGVNVPPVTVPKGPGKVDKVVVVVMVVEEKLPPVKTAVVTVVGVSIGPCATSRPSLFVLLWVNQRAFDATSKRIPVG